MSQRIKKETPMNEKMMPSDEDIRAGRNPENLAFCEEIGRKVARGGILSYWTHYSTRPKGKEEWASHSSYAMQCALEKMAAAGMTSAGLGAWLKGFHAEMRPFIAQRIKTK
jgi:hypothetical protein